MVIKTKETTIGIEHQIIMRAGTRYIFFVCFIVPIMHHFWKYRTGIEVSAWPGQLNRSCMSVHFVSMCGSLCFKHLTSS